MSTRTVPPPPVRRARRATDEAMIGGVAAGLALHLRLPVLWVRIGFLVAAALSGFGVLVYAGLWMFLPAALPASDDAPGLAAASRQGRRPRRPRSIADYGPLVAVGAIVLGVLVLVAMSTGRGWWLWPGVLAVAGIAVLWRQADEAQRDRWVDSGWHSPVRLLLGGGGWGAWTRVVAGALLLLSAVVTFSLRSGDWSAALNVGAAAVLGVIGIGFIAGPWLLRLSRDLGEERAERVRAQERADVAAHLHDSVLQTLAMIQKSAADPATVQRLARAQERDLRGWLFENPVGVQASLVAALRAAAAEVEDAHGVPIEVVAVGDTAVTERMQPVVLAAREAMANAARHSGAAKVDVYCEVDGGRAEVFVRDRGDGFDVEDVPADRLGVRGSIIDRMARHGGTATVSSTPGEGTEVRLELRTHADQDGR